MIESCRPDEVRNTGLRPHSPTDFVLLRSAPAMAMRQHPLGNWLGFLHGTRTHH